MIVGRVFDFKKHSFFSVVKRVGEGLWISFHEGENRYFTFHSQDKMRFLLHVSRFQLQQGEVPVSRDNPLRRGGGLAHTARVLFQV